MDLLKNITSKKSTERKPFKTIVVVNIHNDLLNRETLTKHFSKFGRIVKLNLSLKNENAIISFSKPTEAKLAKEKGTLIAPNVPPVKIFYSDKGADGTRSRTMKPLVSPITSPTSPTPPKPLMTITISKPPVKSSSPIKVASSTTASSSSSSMKPMAMHRKPAKEPLPQGDQHSFYPDTQEAKELFAKAAVTAEERYRLLEARDKIIRARNPKVKVRVEFAVKLVGTCRDMCPEKERYMREAQRQLTSYEMTAGRDGEVDHRLAIKAYARSSADQEEPLPHELRPSITLEMSLAYLLHNIIPRQDAGDDLANWYNFVWDRTRSIRKDITQQQLCDLRAVEMMEKCARFHIHCSSRLCELDRHAFDMKLNDENLMKCLQSLEHMYTDLNLMNVSCPNEPEFRAYQILMNLNEGDILWEIQQKPNWVRESPQVQFAIKVHMAVFEKNYSQFFKLVLSAPYLTACILHRYFFQVRSTALRTIFKAYSIHNKSENHTSMSAVQRVLGFAEDKTELFQYFCSAHGIQCDFERDRINLSKKTFDMPDSPSISREYYLIESKLLQPLNVILNGGPLDTNPYPSHCPHTSFDEYGYLIPGELVGVPDRKREQSKSMISVPTTSAPPPSQQQQQQILSSSAFTVARSTTGSQSLQNLVTNIAPTPGLFSLSTSFPSSFKTPVQAALPLPMMGSSIFGGSNITGSRGGVATSMPPPASLKPIEFPSRFRPIEVDTASRIRQEKIQRASEKIYERMISSEIKRLSVNSWNKAELQRRIKVQRQAEVHQKALLIYSKLENFVVRSKIHDIWNRSRSRNVFVNRKSVELLKTLLEENVKRRIQVICAGSLEEAKRQESNKLRRLSELMRRIQVRFWLEQWKRYTRKSKFERQIRRERKLKELENFPSYQNTYLSSSEEILASWCGGLPDQPSTMTTTRIPTRKSLSPLQSSTSSSWASKGNPRTSINSSPSSAPSSKGNGLLDKSRGNVPDISEDHQGYLNRVRTLIQLYDFPSCSNMSNTSSTSILSSWCGVQHCTDDNLLHVSAGGGGGGECGEIKKRRLDQEFLEAENEGRIEYMD